MSNLTEILDIIKQIKDLQSSSLQSDSPADYKQQVAALFEYLVGLFRIAGVENDLGISIAQLVELVISHLNNTSNPHDVTAYQVGLGNVDNTADIDKPVSTAVQAALDAKSFDMDAHINDLDNPHQVTYQQVGLQEQQFNIGGQPVTGLSITLSDGTVLNLFGENIQDLFNAVQSNVNNHLANTDNPHNVTVDQLGFSEPTVGTFAITLSDGTLFTFANNTDLGTLTTTVTNNGQTLQAHIADTNNPHNVTLAQLNIDTTGVQAILNLPNGTVMPQQTALRSIAGGVFLAPITFVNNLYNIVDTYFGNFQTHLNDNSNPHLVTAAQVGLGNVDNTSDANKPASSAVMALITPMQNTVGSLSTQFSVLTTTVGNMQTQVNNLNDSVAWLNNILGNATHFSFDGPFPDTSTTSIPNPNGATIYLIGNAMPFDLYVYIVSTDTWLQVGLLEFSIDTLVLRTEFNAAVTNIQNQLDSFSTTFNNFGILLQTVQNTSSDHYTDFNNPHQVTAAQIGLGNVANIAPNDLPISNDQATVNSNVNNQLETLTLQQGSTTNDLSNHIGDFTNPHQVTSEQVGLVNVVNNRVDRLVVTRNTDTPVPLFNDPYLTDEPTRGTIALSGNDSVSSGGLASLWDYNILGYNINSLNTRIDNFPLPSFRALSARTIIPAGVNADANLTALPGTRAIMSNFVSLSFTLFWGGAALTLLPAQQPVIVLDIPNDIPLVGFRTLSTFTLGSQVIDGSTIIPVTVGLLGDETTALTTVAGAFVFLPSDPGLSAVGRPPNTNQLIVRLGEYTRADVFGWNFTFGLNTMLTRRKYLVSGSLLLNPGV